MKGFGPILVFEFKIPFTDIVVPITNTVTVTWLIMAALAVVFILTTRNYERIPKKVQNVMEMLVDTITNLTKQTMGPKNIKFAPYIGTVLIYLAVANVIGVIGIRPPTADLNTTMALSIITFCMINYNAVKTKGLFGRIKGFTEPMFLLTPINLLGEIATPISLGFRLFGNLAGGLIIMDLIFGGLKSLSTAIFGANALPIFQLAIPLPLNFYFDIFSGLLQSLIFAMLTMINVSNAMD